MVTSARLCGAENRRMWLSMAGKSSVISPPVSATCSLGQTLPTLVNIPLNHSIIRTQLSGNVSLNTHFSESCLLISMELPQNKCISSLFVEGKR